MVHTVIKLEWQDKSAYHHRCFSFLLEQFKAYYLPKICPGFNSTTSLYRPILGNCPSSERWLFIGKVVSQICRCCAKWKTKRSLCFVGCRWFYGWQTTCIRRNGSTTVRIQGLRVIIVFLGALLMKRTLNPPIPVWIQVSKWNVKQFPIKASRYFSIIVI